MTNKIEAQLTDYEVIILPENEAYRLLFFDEIIDPYYISEQGKIFFPLSYIYITARCRDKGDLHLSVDLGSMRDGHTNPFFVHRLVAAVFLENYKDKPFVHHIDGNPQNNHYSNLLWVTDAEHKKLHKMLNNESAETYAALVADLRKDCPFRKVARQYVYAHKEGATN